MRKPSYDMLSQQSAQFHHQLTCYQIALQCMTHETPDAQVRLTEGGESFGPGAMSGIRVNRPNYIFRLFRADGPHGGILVITFVCPGQNPTTTADYFEQWRAMPSLQTFERIAIERLQQQRMRQTATAG